MKIMRFHRRTDAVSVCRRETPWSTSANCGQTHRAISPRCWSWVRQSWQRWRRLAKAAGPAQIKPLDQVSAALPIANPSKFICLGLNYQDHVAEFEERPPAISDFVPARTELHLSPMESRSSGRWPRSNSTTKLSLRSSSVAPSVTPALRKPWVRSPDMPASTTAPSANSSGIRSSGRWERISTEPAASGLSSYRLTSFPPVRPD